jgi:type IV pilus assembly protein PilA
MLYHRSESGGAAVDHCPADRRRRHGFTLVELSVVVVIVGVLAAFGVPRLLKSVERSKAAEAYSYLSAIRAAQERHQARTGTYANAVADLDVSMATPKYFTVGTPAAGSSGNLQTSWTLALTRSGSSAGYGNYTVVFTQDGFDKASTISADINPMQ